MDAIVENDYSIIYFHHGLNSKVQSSAMRCFVDGSPGMRLQNKPTLAWLRRVYSSFDRKYEPSPSAPSSYLRPRPRPLSPLLFQHTIFSF